MWAWVVPFDPSKDYVSHEYVYVCSREMFNKWQAQRWWGDNYDRIMELYNVQRFNRQALNTPSRSEDEVNVLHAYFAVIQNTFRLVFLFKQTNPVTAETSFNYILV